MLTLQNNTFYYDSFMYVNSVADHIPHSSPTTPAAPVTLHDVPPPNFMLSSSYVFWCLVRFVQVVWRRDYFARSLLGSQLMLSYHFIEVGPAPFPLTPARQNKEPIDNGFHKVNSCIGDRSWSNC